MTDLEEAISLIYRAATEPTLWAAVMSMACRIANVPACGVKVIYRRDDRMRQTWHGLPEGFERSYVADGYWKQDPWSAETSRIPDRRVFRGGELVPTRELERLPFYNDLCRPFRLHDVIGTVLFRTPELEVTFGLMRSLDETGDERRVLDVGEALVGPLAAAWNIELTREAAETDRRAALSAGGLLTLWVRRDGTVTLANAAAEALLRKGDGLLTRGGVLTASDHRDAEALRAMLASGGPGRSAAIGRPSGARPLVLLLASAPPAWGADLTIYVFDPELQAAPVGVALEQAYGLTLAEARLALALAEGLTPQEAADELGVRISTVRTQLASIFAKTGTRRQSELVALVARLMAQRSATPR